MEELDLGPNGGLKYSMHFLAENLEWLSHRLAALPPNNYLLFDLPGQVELYAVEEDLQKIIEYLTRKLNIQITCIHLTDSQHILDQFKYISSIFLCLNAMLMLEAPFVNVRFLRIYI